MKSEQLESVKQRYHALAQEQADLIDKIESAKQSQDHKAVKRYKADLEVCRKLLTSVKKCLYS